MEYQEQLKPSCSRTKQSRSVRFERKVSVRELLHVNDYTDEEIEDTWYNDDDLYLIKVDIGNTLDKISCGKLEVDTETVSRRGLEFFIDDEDAQNQKLRERRAAINSVLQLQDLCNRDIIARVYSKYTQQATTKAYFLAIQDESEAHHSFRISRPSSSYSQRIPRIANKKGSVTVTTPKVSSPLRSTIANGPRKIPRH